MFHRCLHQNTGDTMQLVISPLFAAKFHVMCQIIIIIFILQRLILVYSGEITDASFSNPGAVLPNIRL